MAPKAPVAALLFSCMLAGAAFAQSADIAAGAQDRSMVSSSEYGRTSGGEIGLMTKHGSRFSGSFGLTRSTSHTGFATLGSRARNAYDLTLGGTLVEDRVWFFTSAQKTDGLLASRYAPVAQNPATGIDARSLDARLNAQLGDRSSLDALFAAGRQQSVTPLNTSLLTPESFLSLRYTGVVSSNMSFSASFTQKGTTTPRAIE